MRGFSLVELLVAVGITSLLVASGVPAFRSYQQQVNGERVANDVAELIVAARTLALSPGADKADEVAAYGVTFSVARVPKILELREFSIAGSNYVPGRVEQTLMLPSDITDVRIAPSEATHVLFPLAMFGASTSSVAVTIVGGNNWTRTVAVTGPTGQVQVQHAQ